MKFFIIFLSTFFPYFAFAQGSTIKDLMIPTGEVGGVKTIMDDTGTGMLDTLLAFARDSIFSLLALLAIALFIYIGAKLIMARGNQEEFKKAMQMFLYTIIGLFIVGASFVAVKLIAGLTF